MRHHLQRSILDSLATASTRRYSDLNVNNLDGNVFTYHLKQLLRDNLVQQTIDGDYSLTHTGRHYIIHRYENSAQSAHSIFLVIIRHNDKLLLRKRLVQPMISYSGFVHGEPRVNEPIEKTVRSRVLAKTGLDLHTVSIHSSGLIQISVDSVVDTFSHAVLVTAEAINPETLAKHDETGQNYWVSESELTSTNWLLPSCLDLLEHSRSTQSWFSLEYTM